MALAGCGAMGTNPPAPVETQDLAVPTTAPADLAPASACGPCDGGAPFCEPKLKRCVACLADSDCPPDFLCHANACMPGCSANHSACGDAGSCDVDMGLCHGCLSDGDCADAKNPFCDPVSGRCGPCSTQNDRCPPGTYCGLSGGALSCLPGCRGDLECRTADGGTAFSACCNHACVDVNSSLANCGACGAACNKGACCTGRCVDPQSDAMNCGGCNMPCPMANDVPSCTAGKCGIGMCQMGFADCDGNPANGCEVATGGDAKNCGGCNRVCMLNNASALCVGGACAIGNCAPGFRDCDGAPANGCEVQVASDPMNCGTCGQNCGMLPHATAGCMNGMCVIGACAPGFADCNQIGGDGCESAVASDPLNCGGCNHVCPGPPNVVVTCSMSTCGLGGCQPGFADCNNNMNDGCEAQLASDPKNCGKCGVTCAPMGQNTVAGCTGGMCSVQCAMGFGDCDKNLGNGCEANLNTDVNNCGACGMVCGNGQSCVNGTCNAVVACQAGSVQMAISPNKDMIVCHHPQNAICEQDFATECPPGWRLCTPKQHANRRNGWNYFPPTELLGEIFCRGGGGAGSWTIFPNVNMSQLQPFNCNDGSSRQACPTGYGCNEQQYYALCCRPTPSCGNGVVDSPEEECDDGNQSELDNCLNDCAVRTPGNGC